MVNFYQAALLHKKPVWFSITIKTALRQILDQCLLSPQAFKTTEENIHQEDPLQEFLEWIVLLRNKRQRTLQDRNLNEFIKIRRDILLKDQIKCLAFKEENRQDSLLQAKTSSKEPLIKANQVVEGYLLYLKGK